MSSNKENQSYKYCFVPECESTTIRTPNKRFIHVPKNDGVRQKWMKMCGREKTGAKTTVFYCCEDHFDFEKDFSNMIEHQLTGCSLRLKEGVLPSKFNCQPDGKQSPSNERQHSINKRKMEVIENCLRSCLKDIEVLSEECQVPQEKLTQTNISGPYSSGSKLKGADPNRPSTSTQEEVFPDVGFFQGLPEIEPQSISTVYDPNIVIKQEIIETEVDPINVLDASTFAESLHQETITPNVPKSLLGPTISAEVSETLTDSYMVALNTSKNVPSATQSHNIVTAPITRLKVIESSSVVPAKSSKHYKKTAFRKVFVKKGGKRSPDPSGSSSDEDEGRRRPRDKFDTYAEFIASKLRDLDPRSCAFVQTAIADLIFEAELGRFLSEGDKSIFASKTQELLKNMPPPCENET